MALELPEGVSDFIQGLKVIWGQHLSLNDREVDFDLIEPTAVNRSMDQLQARIPLLEPFDAGNSSMRGTIIDDPEHAAGLGIGGLVHHPIDQMVKGDNAALRLAVAEEFGAMDIQGRHIGKGPPPLVLMFHLHWLARSGSLGGMDASAGLDAGLLIGRNHVLVRLQRLPLPDSLVEIKQASGFDRELRVARENPTAVEPRSDGVFMEPAPERAVTDFGHQPGLTDLLIQLRQTPARQRQAELTGQFTSQSFNLHDQFWGERPGGDPGGEVLPARVSAQGRSVCAIG